MKHVYTALVAILAGSLHAQTPDPSFGTGGITTLALDENANVYASFLADDGRILVTGARIGNGTNDLFLARFTANGQPDVTFGTAGVVIADDIADNSTGWDVAVQDDGRIVVAASRELPGQRNFLVRRYLTDGTIDPTFGTGGTWTSNWTVQEQPRGIALQPDGKILLAGQWLAPVARAVVVRLNTDGTLDTGYGNFGAASHPNTTDQSWAWSVLALPDGKALVTGDVNGEDAFIARLQADGSFDEGFANAGFHELNSASHHDSGFRMLQAPDGTLRWLVIGFNATGTHAETWLYKFDADGTALTYGGGIGEMMPLTSNTYPLALALDAADRVVVGAEDWANDNATLMARNTPEGMLDASFGTAGMLSVGDHPFMSVSDVHVRPDGRIVFVGTADDGTGNRIFLEQFMDASAGIAESPGPVTVQWMPNPGEGLYTVSTEDGPIVRIDVMDAQGRIVRTQGRSPARTTLDLGALPAGAYLARIITPGGIGLQRFIQR